MSLKRWISNGVIAGALCTSLNVFAIDTPILSSSNADWRIEEVISDLDYPWDIVRNGAQLLITEKAGDIVAVQGESESRANFLPSDPLRTYSGSGLLGMALSPDFEQDRSAFFYYSYGQGSTKLNRVVSAKFDGTDWVEQSILVDAIPGHDYYNGGRLAISPDGYLYITTGWTENNQRPQDLNNLAGKILRINLDGSIPSDNPFGATSPIYSYGHRNPQGLAWSPAGELFVSEHGSIRLDELNKVTAGKNYGWPIISGDERQSNMETAYIHSGNSTWAPSGLAFVGDELVMATLKGNRLYVLNEASDTLKPLENTGDRYRQVLAAENGFYVITTNRSPRSSGKSNDRLLRYTLTN